MCRAYLVQQSTHYSIVVIMRNERLHKHYWPEILSRNKTGATTAMYTKKIDEIYLSEGNSNPKITAALQLR